MRRGRKVAFTLSESVCIAGRKESFGQMIDSGGVDLLFANEDEALQLTGRADLKDALTELSIKVPTLVVTKGPEGAIAIENGERISIPAAPVSEVVDTTGAGDLFAAGFLDRPLQGRQPRALPVDRRDRRGRGDPALWRAADHRPEGAGAAMNHSSGSRSIAARRRAATRPSPTWRARWSARWPRAASTWSMAAGGSA